MYFLRPLRRFGPLKNVMDMMISVIGSMKEELMFQRRCLVGLVKKMSERRFGKLCSRQLSNKHFKVKIGFKSWIILEDIIK